MWDLSSSGGTQLCVCAGGGDQALLLAGHCANDTVNCFLSCSVPFPACKGVNLSAFTRKPSGQTLILSVPLEQEEL